jgi:hypothetical protein
MNVTFHTLTSLAIAAALSTKQTKPIANESFVFSDVPLLSIGFVTGVMIHGLLDFVPHSYPIKSIVDVVLSLGLSPAVMIFIQQRHRLLAALCFLGVIFPDLVDLGPAILNSHLGWHLPVVKIFPWHWPQYSGSIYNGSRPLSSLAAYSLVAGVSLSLLYLCRKNFFRSYQER